MSEELNPIKDYLFEYIKKSDTIPKLISEKKFDVIINEIVENCYDKVISMGEKEEAIGVLATGILHYLLTNALLNSQRKVEYQGVELDIVIPDTRTLEKDSKMTLLIIIPKSSNSEFNGYFKFSTCPVGLPSLSKATLKISNPPKPICASEEKYNVLPSSVK